MANALNTNPWILDTGSADPVHQFTAFIAAIHWSGYSTEGDDLIVKDGEGNTILHWKGKADLSPIGLEAGRDFRISGFTLATIDAGQLAVFLK